MPAFGTEIRNKILAAQNTTLEMYKSMMSCFGTDETTGYPSSPLQTEEMVREAIAEVQEGIDTGLLEQEETQTNLEERTTAANAAIPTTTAQPSLLFHYLDKVGLNKISQYFNNQDMGGYQLIRNDVVPHVETASQPAPPISTAKPAQLTYEPPKPVPTPLPKEDALSAVPAPLELTSMSTLSLYQSALENPEAGSTSTLLPAKPTLKPKEDRTHSMIGLKLPPTGALTTKLKDSGLKL